MKKINKIGWLNFYLLILFFTHSINVSAIERHAVYLERNYADEHGIMHHMTKQGHIMAEEEFTNTIDPYKDYQIIDVFNDKQTVITKLNEAFKNSKSEDINYLVIESHGSANGIINFTFEELKNILDKYQGHFVINITACESGGAIDKIPAKIYQIFNSSQKDNSKFENSKYTIYCSSTKNQLTYDNNSYAPYTKAYFNASKIGENGFLNADYNQDCIVTANELSKYLAINGANAGATPVFQIPEPELPVFSTNRPHTHTTLTFKHTPGEPVWYGIIPKNQIFKDDNLDEDVDATIKIAGDFVNKNAYTGTGKIDVSVKSANGFNLEEGKVTVPYVLTDKGGKTVNKINDKVAEKLATLTKDVSSVKYNFHLTGTNKNQVTTNANLTDTLTYVFHEQ